jgi:tetratricopeptide (TPR) repeat protein
VLIRSARWFSCALVATVLLGSSSAVAADATQTRVARLSFDVESVASRAEALAQRVEPGRGFITDRQALQRFELNLYQFMVGDYDRAAEGFFALVTTQALTDPALHQDAEWYLAESLFQTGNLVTAEMRFRAIAAEAAHPFHDEAVRRILELYAVTSQPSKFQAAYQREIVAAQVRPSDLVTYTVGKSQYSQKQYAAAEATLASIAAGSSVYRRARYFLGVVRTASGDLDGALTAFTEVSEQSVETGEDRRVHDLALLARARIHYERQEFALAAEVYGRIGSDSEYLADKLYEIIWTFVKQSAWEDAAGAVDIFLLAFPEHAFAARVSLMRGQLHIKTVQYDEALAAFEGVIAEYTPVRDRFVALAAGEGDSVEVFRKMSARSGDTGLPLFARSMMESNREFSRGLKAHRELLELGQDVAVSEGLIRELQDALDTSAGIGGYERTRVDIDLLRSQLLQQRLDLARVEESWAWSQRGRPRAELEKLRKRREALREQALNRDARAPGYSDAAVVAEIVAIEQGLLVVRSQFSGSGFAAQADAIDVLRTLLLATDTELASLHVSVDSLEAAEVARIRERLKAETEEVSDQRRDLDRTRVEAERVGGELTRAGFRTLANFFADAVMRADMGVVDVYWAQKLELADKRESMLEMRNLLLEELERRFELIRQNLGSAPAAQTAGGPR